MRDGADGAGEGSWRRFALGAALLLATAVLGVLAAPPVHALLVDWGALAEEDFPRVLRRTVLLPVLAVLFLLLRPWREGGPRTWGLLGPRARPRPALLAYGTTILVALLILAWHFAEGWLRFEEPLRWGRALGRAGRWLLVGALIGLTEEWFFRGWMDRVLRRHAGALAAALLVAALYAALHAFKPSSLEVEVPSDLAGAWQALAAWGGRLLDPLAFGPPFVGLFLLSLLLTALWRRSGSLWVPAAVHAAGVFVLYAYGGFTERWPPENWAGSKRLYDGPVTWALLAGLVLLLWPRRGEERPEPPAQPAPDPL